MILETYQESDGIKIFHNTPEDHQDYNAKGLDHLFSQEENHFWFIARKEFILAQMLKHVDTKSAIIEIGAGTGNVARYLQHNGYNDFSVGEMHISGLKYAKSYGIDKCYQFDLLRAPFENEFDTVCMFDVLEHIENDKLALQNVYQMLKNRGEVVISVPAHMWLWNRDDSIAGHKRRYTKGQLVDLLNKAGFTIVKARYFFISILPLLYLRTLINKDSRLPVSEEELNEAISMNPLLSKILLFISRIENQLNKILPNWFGGSLLVIARKNGSVSHSSPNRQRRTVRFHASEKL